jgi:hypothetical protein
VFVLLPSGNSRSVIATDKFCIVATAGDPASLKRRGARYPKICGALFVVHLVLCVSTMRFFAAVFAALASLASAEITSSLQSIALHILSTNDTPPLIPAIYQTYGACQSDIFTTLPLPYATTTSTFTIPLTTTVTRSVYPTAAPNRARGAADPAFLNATPAPELDERAMEERDLTIVYSWVLSRSCRERNDIREADGNCARFARAQTP